MIRSKKEKCVFGSFKLVVTYMNVFYSQAYNRKVTSAIELLVKKAIELCILNG
jgi:hypothetical protein